MMRTPDSINTLPVAENLDDARREIAIRLGEETLSRMEQLIKDAKARNLAERQRRDAERDRLTTA